MDPSTSKCPTPKKKKVNDTSDLTAGDLDVLDFLKELDQQVNLGLNEEEALALTTTKRDESKPEHIKKPRQGPSSAFAASSPKKSSKINLDNRRKLPFKATTTSTDQPNLNFLASSSFNCASSSKSPSKCPRDSPEQKTSVKHVENSLSTDLNKSQSHDQNPTSHLVSHHSDPNQTFEPGATPVPSSDPEPLNLNPEEFTEGSSIISGEFVISKSEWGLACNFEKPLLKKLKILVLAHQVFIVKYEGRDKNLHLILKGFSQKSIEKAVKRLQDYFNSLKNPMANSSLDSGGGNLL